MRVSKLPFFNYLPNPRLQVRSRPKNAQLTLADVNTVDLTDFLVSSCGLGDAVTWSPLLAASPPISSLIHENDCRGGDVIILIFDVQTYPKNPMGGTSCTTKPKALAHYT